MITMNFTRISGSASLSFHQGDIDFIGGDSFFITGDGHLKTNRIALPKNLGLQWLNGENKPCYIQCVHGLSFFLSNLLSHSSRVFYSAFPHST
jgi:hypothetical protein